MKQRQGKLHDLFASMKIMLPEHIEALRRYQLQKKKFQPPELDDQFLEHLNYALQEAYEKKCLVNVTYSGSYGSKTFRGTIKQIDLYGQQIEFKHAKGHSLTLSIHSILNIELE